MRSTVDEMAVKKVSRIRENLTQKGCTHSPTTRQIFDIKGFRDTVRKSDPRLEGTHQTATNSGNVPNHAQNGDQR